MIDYVILGLAVFVVVAGVFILGRYKGRKEEREWCCTVIQHSMCIRFSPTAHEALVCMAGNQTLMEMDRNLKEINDYVEQKK